MKTRSYASLFAGAVTYISLALLLSAYDNVSMHPAINSIIIEGFNERFINASTPLERLQNYHFELYGGETCAGPAVVGSGFIQATMNEEIRSKTPGEWIEHGGYSCDEPEFPAALRHFYDPLGTDNGKTFLSDRGTYWEWLVNNYAFNPSINAKDWALSHNDNQWTFEKGKQHLINAMLEENDARRSEHMARAWRCLGETLHLIADMGCPPHVRNDSHAAPMGWKFRAVLGNPDPCEELMERSYATTYAQGSADPTLKTAFRDAEKAEVIFDGLARFTNRNFFSEQTIIGQGHKYINQIKKTPGYPSPLLENLLYNTADYSYYATFPGGQSVRMCKDRGYFNQRTYPYIDEDCVKSQAAVLMPNIVEAGANIIRLFAPSITVQVSSATLDGMVEGSVVMSRTEEYPVTHVCQGKVYFMVDGEEVHSTLLDSEGEFQASGLAVQESDDVVVEYRLAGIVIRSDPFTVQGGLLARLKSSTAVLIRFSGMHTWSDNISASSNIEFGYFSHDPAVGQQPLAWSGNSFTFSYDHKWGTPPDTSRHSYLITGTVSSDGTTVLSLMAEDMSMTPYGGTTTGRLQLHNLPHDGAFSYGKSDGLDFGTYSSAAMNFFVSYVGNTLHTDSQGQKVIVDYVSTDWMDSANPPFLYVQFFK